MKNGPVFYDPKGRRERVVTSGGKVAGIFVGILSTIFIISLFGVAFSPIVFTKDAKKGLVPINSRPDVPSGLIIGRIRTELLKEVKQERAKPGAKVETEQRIIGFYTLNDAGFQSFKNKVANLTHLMPQGYRISATGDHLVTQDFDYDQNKAEILQLCSKNHIKVLPIISNYETSGFSASAVHRLLSSPTNYLRLASEIKQKLLADHLDGINVDLENLPDGDRPALVKFIQALRVQFNGTNLQLTTDLEVQTDPVWQARYAASCDFAILMAYDEHDEGGDEGPISSVGWIQKNLRATLDHIPTDKLVLGIGAYSLDWVHGKSGGATSPSYQEALTTAAGYITDLAPKDSIRFDPGSLNSYFEYNDDQNVTHICWMQDGITAYNAWRLGRDEGINGFAVWALGDEDPSIWTFLDRGSTAFDDPVAHLETVEYPYEVENIGKGDLLTVGHLQQSGKRHVSIDPNTSLVMASNYESYPSPYVIQHHGYSEKRVTLTFDDGPDPQYTGRILDILKQEGVTATFFMIGEKAEESPRLVQRVYAEGHEIGSHTFFHPDLGEVSTRRVNLELNATQRSIQSIVGRSTALFRPPYNADRDPAKPNEVGPILIADHLGYTIVGETIDPTDWDPNKFDSATNRFRPRTVDDIVSDTFVGVKQFDVPSKSNRDGGNCILLHDAGGDREKTVQALPRIIEGLRARGYTFCNVSDLAGLTREKVMPPISDREKTLILLDKIAFGAIFTVLQVLAYAFLLAIGLGVARIVLIVPLALLYERRQRKVTYDPTFRPEVSVLVAAYNEEKVIARTIQSILDSEYPVGEVVVVDDGSSDETLATALAVAADQPRVRVIHQENSGKANALEHALLESQNSILISVDADTQLLPDAIGLLVRHFQDPDVGAVAGNVQVGNANNIVTTWQAIEYTTSQNMDRRAYGLLNCITVVPGAIGAWRKQAVVAVGGHQDDTLAEDMDLTWRLRIAGWKLETESYAYAYTEAPEKLKSFFKQRFRWAYGTLQCLVKHKQALFRYGWFGRFALPVIWLFQFVFQSIAPFVDLQILISLLGFVLALKFSDTSKETSPLGQATSNLQEVLLLYAIFFAIEMIAALIAYRMENKRFAALWWLFLQRFVYRQVMYSVVIRSLRMAVQGARQGWGKLDRTANVKLGK